MTLHDYLTKNLSQTAMITLSIDNQESFQYNYWNWLHQIGEFHLLKNDYSIGHIIYCGDIIENNDGSIVHSSKHHPKQSVMNFYFGGVTN